MKQGIGFPVLCFFAFLNENKLDERYPDLTRDELIKHTILAISL